MLTYKGLHAVRETLHVSDEMVEQQITRLLEQRVKYIPVTGRPSQLDDELVLDYAGEVDGIFFEGGTATNQTLVLGSGMFIPGFEEQLVGKNPGDEADVFVTFPEQYHAPDLAGKKAVFHCKVNEIRLKEKYQADDTFAREVGSCETIEKFRENLKSGLQEYVDNQADAELKDQLLNQICDNYECELSEEQVNAAVDYEIQMLEAQLGRQGLNLDMYCQFTGKSKDDLRDEYLPTARRNLVRQKVIDEIAEIEKVEADEASVAEMLGQICAENGITLEQLEPQIDEHFKAAVEQGVINTKVLNLIRDSAVIEDVVKEA